MSTYEFNHNEISVTSNDDIMSKKLLVYSAMLDEKKFAKTIIDDDVSMLYLNEKLAEKMSVEVTRIMLRKIKVANKDMIMVNDICIFEMKLGNLSKETITTYTFPLDNIDLILGLS